MNEYAPPKRISSFHPPQRTLMDPGPTEIHPRVIGMEYCFVNLDEDHRGDRRAGGNRAHAHAPGAVRPATATHAVNIGVNSGARVNRHAIDDRAGRAIECRWFEITFNE